MHQSEIAGETILDRIRLQARWPDHPDHRREDPRPDRPHVQVDHARRAVVLDRGAHGLFGLRRALAVEQDARRLPHQADRPVRHEHCADHAHHRVQPGEPEVAPGQERDDRRDRSERVGHHVQVGRTQVVVVRMIVTMPMPVLVIVRVPVRDVVAVRAEDHHRQPVDDQPDHRHRDRVAVADLDRVQEAFDALDHHEHREADEQQRAREAGQRVDLARAEAVAAVEGVASGVGVGHRGQPERDRVRAHVQPVGEQRHRPEGDAGDDLDHHGEHGDHHDDPRAPLARPRQVLAEAVVVAVGAVVARSHGAEGESAVVSTATRGRARGAEDSRDGGR